MPLPGREQTFAYVNCSDVLEKLRRELDRYRSIVGSDRPSVDDLRDTAFNASVTAWHLADWVFHELTAEQKKKLGFSKLSDLQNYARSNCRALYLCRYAATASKHWEVKEHPDSTVQIVVAAEEDWAVYFIDAKGRGRVAADQIFDEALHFWTHLIYSNKIAFGPDDL
jgi:predicted acetyltransferase